jgi:DNA-binding transcriptional ArsR family regulator
LQANVPEPVKESVIHGTTLRVYWYLFKNARSVGVRETQRALSMSSPSIALYHLEKLRELGVAEKNDQGEYGLRQQVPIGTLKMFLRIGHLILPRYLFYAIFFTAATFAYAAQTILQGSSMEPIGIIFGLAAAGVCWYECARMWKDRVL